MMEMRAADVIASQKLTNLRVLQLHDAAMTDADAERARQPHVRETGGTLPLLGPAALDGRAEEAREAVRRQVLVQLRGGVTAGFIWHAESGG